MAGAVAGFGLQEKQVVVFELQKQYFAIDINSVVEIIHPEEITVVPGSEGFIEGVINLRGRVIPVIDLGRYFGLSSSSVTENTRVIIVVEAEGIVMGVVVDDVSEVLRFSSEHIKPLPSMISASYLKGIILIEERLIILLELNCLLCEEAKEALRSG